MGELIGLVAVNCVFSTPVVAILANHRQKIAEIKSREGSGDPGLAKEIRDLKRQVEEMRDTTSRYDMSFDTALQRLESRVSNVETRLGTMQSETQTIDGRRV